MTREELQALCDQFRDIKHTSTNPRVVMALSDCHSGIRPITRSCQIGSSAPTGCRSAQLQDFSPRSRPKSKPPPRATQRRSPRVKTGAGFQPVRPAAILAAELLGRAQTARSITADPPMNPISSILRIICASSSSAVVFRYHRMNEQMAAGRTAASFGSPTQFKQRRSDAGLCLIDLWNGFITLGGIAI